MKKWFLLLPLIFIGSGANHNIITVTKDAPAPPPVVIPASDPNAFGIEGKCEVEEGKLLQLRIKGVTTKVDPETGLRTPGIQWGMHPLLDDMKVDTDGQGITMCSPDAGKSFLLVAAVNNVDPLKPPLVIMKMITIKPKLTPDPITPVPVPVPVVTVPDDQFDNVGKLVNQTTLTFPGDQRKATAAIYRTIANGLEDGTYPTINSATAQCQANRHTTWGSSTQWPLFEAAVTPVWNKFWANPSKQMVIDFYRAVAKGLDP